MVYNPLSDLLKEKKANDKPLVPESAAIKEKMENIRAYKAATETKPATPAAPKENNDRPMHPGAKYGDKPGEARPESMPWLKDAVKPLGSAPKMHKGGEVPKTGPYTLKKGEHVLTEEHKDKIKHGLHLAEAVLAHDAAPEPDKDEPKKEIREMRIRKGHGGKGRIVEHHHASPHPMEEHVLSDMKALHKHMDEHMGDEPEGSEEESKESPGVQQMEQALGYEK